MKKKIILLVASFGVITACAFSLGLEKVTHFGTSFADGVNYDLVFSETKNVLTSSTSLDSGVSTAVTNLENDVDCEYGNAKHEKGSWITLENGYIANCTAVNDISKIFINVSSGSIDVLTGSYANNVISYDKCINVTGESSLDIDQGISHFKLAGSGVIESLAFKYNCASGVTTDITTVSLKGNGSEAYPFEVDNKQAWDAISTMTQNSDFAGKYIEITDDIEGITTKIGNYQTGFAGVLNGNGNTISLNYSFGGGVANQGLIGHLKSGGILKNLVLTGSLSSTSTSGDLNIGPAVGVLSGGRVEDVSSFVNVSVKSFVVGGVVGKTDSSSVIKNCVFDGSFTFGGTSTTNISLGGIVGIANGTIENCINKTDFSVTGVQVGGIAGKGENTNFVSCTNYGNITTSSNNVDTSKTGLGGIAGLANYGSIKGCKNYGKIEATNATMVGGIGGKICDGETLEDTTNYGEVKGKGQVGGLGGRVKGGSDVHIKFKNCVNLGNVNQTATGDSSVAGFAGFAQYIDFDHCVNGEESSSEKGVITTSGNHTGTNNQGMGGLFPYGEHITADYCVNYAPIQGNCSEVGGLGGKSNACSFTNCTNSGEIKGTNYVGGIVGRIVEGGTYTNNTNIGHIICSGANKGQIYGQKNGTVTEAGNIENGSIN